MYRLGVWAAACGLLSSGLLVLEGGVSGAASGKSGSPVAIGITYPLSGKDTAASLPILGAIRAWTDYVNSQGGVKMRDGVRRKIKLDVLNGQGDPAQDVSNARQLVQQDHVAAFCCTWATPSATALNSYLKTVHVPQLFYLGNSAFFNIKSTPYTTASSAPTTLDGAVWTKYLIKHIPDARIGLFTDTTSFGAGTVSAIKRVLSSSHTNVKLVAVQHYQPTDTTETSQIEALRSAGANVLWDEGDAPNSELALKAAENLGWHPAARIIGNNGTDVKQLATVGSLSSLKGLLGGLNAADPAQSQYSKELQTYFKVMKKYAPHVDATDIYSLVGAQDMFNVVQVLQNAKKPTSSAIVQSTKNLHIKNELGGLPGMKFGLWPAHPFITQALVPAQFNGSTWETIGSPISASAAQLTFNG